MAFPLPADILDNCIGGNLYCWSAWANTVTNGSFWVMILLAFVVMLFLATQRFGTPRSFGFSSIVGMIGAAFLSILQLMPWWIGSIFILAGAGGFVVLILNQK